MEIKLHLYTLLIHVFGLILLLASSSKVVKWMMKSVYSKALEEIAKEDNNSDEEVEKKKAEQHKRISTGRIIGKCENVIIIILMFFQAYTSLAIIFTAKTIIRKEDIIKNSMYFLVGTMINVTYSLFIGFIIHFFAQLLREFYACS